MKTSRLAVFHGPGRPFTLATVPVPALREGEILVRNEYTTLCRSDLNTFSGKRRERTPTILGHETIGVVEELAAGAPARDARGRDLRVGDRVTWAIYAANPDSWLARVGIPQKGPGLFKYGHEPITADSTLHGGLAEYCILRRHTPVIRMDAPMPLPVMALINCSVATVAGSLRLAGPLTERNVLIAGAGMLGVIACAMCRCAGARWIVAADIDDARLATARAFGADFTVNLQSGSGSLKDQVERFFPGEAVTVGLDYSGVPETMEALVGVLGVGGSAVFIGATFPQRPLQINAEQLIRNVHTIRGLHNYNEWDFIAAVNFMEQNHQRFPFASLVEDRFRLESVNEAFDYGLKSGAHRVGVRLGRDS
jgi:alcohol dehydrogenase